MLTTPLNEMHTSEAMQSFPTSNKSHDERQRGNIQPDAAHGVMASNTYVYQPILFPHQRFPRSQNEVSFSSFLWKEEKM